MIGERVRRADLGWVRLGKRGPCSWNGERVAMAGPARPCPIPRWIRGFVLRSVRLASFGIGARSSLPLPIPMASLRVFDETNPFGGRLGSFGINPRGTDRIKGAGWSIGFVWSGFGV